MRSMQFGFYDNIIDQVVNSYSGYIQVHADGYWEKQSVNNSIELDDSLINKISSVEGVDNVSKRLQTFSLVSKGDKSKGAIINGIEIEKEQLIIDWDKKIIKCSKSLKNDDSVILSKGIAEYFDIKVGDTLTLLEDEASKALDGYKDIKPMVFSGIFPVDGEQYEELKEALRKLALNDSSLSYELETSAALGFGFRCGFSGLLHMEITQERLEREFNLQLITTAPSVVYKVHLNKGDIIDLQNPSSLPDPTYIKFIEEPWIKSTIIAPDQYLGSIIKICQDKRGVQTNLSYSGKRAVLSLSLIHI